MKILKEIIEQLGCVTSAQLRVMEAEYPRVPLVIKWGYKNREQFFAAEIQSKINEEKEDHVREVFMSTKTLRYIENLVDQFERCPRD